jgi:hypothetical protein
MEFHQKRRQQFLGEVAYNETRKYVEETSIPRFKRAISAPESSAEDRTRLADACADYSFTNYMLRYTGGDAIESLREDLAEIIGAHEQAAKYVQEFEKDPAFPPLRFIEIDEYERVLQLIGLCYLLHRQDLLPRIAKMLDASSAARDTLYEDLLAFELEDRYDLDSWYHDAPYRDLINSLYRDTDEESIADLKLYLKNWYAALAKAPWHNSHLTMEGDSCGAYFGYWAIEAAAVAYLLELDDSSFRDHLVYPKDLVDFARKMDLEAPADTTPTDRSKLRVEGGEKCPRSGFWSTPAMNNTRRHFTEGDLMPVFESSSYGATIWQWSENQEPDAD